MDLIFMKIYIFWCGEKLSDMTTFYSLNYGVFFMHIFVMKILIKLQENEWFSGVKGMVIVKKKMGKGLGFA